MSMSRYGDSASRNRGAAPIARIVATCFFAFAHGVFGDSYAQGGAETLPPIARGSCMQDQGSTLPALAAPPAERELDLSELDAYRVPHGVYRPLGDECSRRADLERIVCKAGAQGCIEDHGTYVRDEFLFADPVVDSAANKVRIISDRSLDILVERDNSDPLRFTFDIEGSAIPGEIQIDDPGCLGQGECFVVRNVPVGFGLRNGAYARTRPLDAERNDQNWSSSFKQAPANLRTALLCYDVRKLDEDKIHAATRDGGGLCRGEKGWFLEPNGEDKTFELISAEHNVAVPFGLKYISRNQQWGGERTDMFETETEINDNRSSTLGWKTGINLIIINAEVHHNETTLAKRQNLSNNDVTYSKFEQKDADFAVVLDRFNLALTDDFKNKVAATAKVFKKNRDAAKTNARARQAIDDQYAAFIEQVGTHVPYATTFGRRAFQWQTYTKEAVQQLAEDGVSVSTGASVGVSMPIPELGGTVGANFGVDSGDSKDHAKRLKKVLGKSWSS